MNNYILYCQENSESIVNLKSTCRDVFEIIGESEMVKSVYGHIKQLMENRSTFALVDPNGTVICTDLAIQKCIINKDRRVIIHTFQLKRVV